MTGHPLDGKVGDEVEMRYSILPYWSHSVEISGSSLLFASHDKLDVHRVQDHSFIRSFHPHSASA